MIITYSERVFRALFTQHAQCTLLIILSSVACPDLPLSYKRHEFREKKIHIKQNVF